MKKRIVSLTAVLILVLSITAQAAALRMPQVNPSLSFSGTTASCTASVRSGTDAIVVTMALWSGGSKLASWTASGQGSVFLSKTCAGCVKGNTHTLLVDVTINGVSQPQVSASNIC